MKKLRQLIPGVSLLLFGLLGISATPVAALNGEKLESALQLRIEADPTNAGVVFGVIDGSQIKLIFEGVVDKTSNVSPDEHSLFEIGSITKTFTGILLADMVLKGELNLDDPVQKYLPKGVTLPMKSGKEITLLHLATHSSGLPRMPDNISPKDPKNPYVDYSVESLYEFISGYELTREIGEKSTYSNLGMGLLGHVLALKAGISYEQLVTKRILTPLGMNETTITLSSAHKKKMTVGHDNRGMSTSLWDIISLAGAGGLRSSGHDMMIYLRANMGLIKTPLADAIELSHKYQRKYSGSTSIGLAWMTKKNSHGKITSHGGSTGGFRTYIGFNQSIKKGVVVLSNSKDNSREIGNAILTNRIENILPLKTVKVSSDILKTYVGIYKSETHKRDITITLDEGLLYGQATGQRIFLLSSLSEQKFVFKKIDIELDFHTTKKQFNITQRGKIDLFTRVGDSLKGSSKIDEFSQKTM